MSNPLETARKQLHEILCLEIADYDYRFIRYRTDYSVAIAYLPEPVDLSGLAAYIRRTDRFIVLDPHLYVAVFDNSDHEKGLKAANNLLTYFLHSHFAKSIYTAIVTSGDYNDKTTMISKLFNLLEYAIGHNMNTLIIDDTQVMKKA